MTKITRHNDFIKAKIFKAALVAVFSFTLLVLVLPTPVRADDTCANLSSRTQATTTNGTVIHLDSGLPHFCTINAVYQQVITIVLTFSGSVAVLFLIIGGFQYLTSAGNEEQSEKAKKIIINSVIGLVVIIMAAAIVRIVTELLTSSSATPTTPTTQNP